MTIHETTKRPPTEADCALGFNSDTWEKGGTYLYVYAWDGQEWGEATLRELDTNSPSYNTYTHWFDPKEGPVEPKLSLED